MGKEMGDQILIIPYAGERERERKVFVFQTTLNNSAEIFWSNKIKTAMNRVSSQPSLVCINRYSFCVMEPHVNRITNESKYML